MKKFISMVMAAAMVVSLVPATAFAADNTCSLKVVKAAEATKDAAKAANWDTDFVDAKAQIQITIGNIDTLTSSQDTFEIDLDFDGAKVANTFNTAQAWNNATWTDVSVNTVAGAVDVQIQPAEKDDETITLKITEAASADFATGDIITLPLDGATNALVLALKSVKEGATASVAVSGDLGSADAKTFASVLGQTLKIKTKKLVEVGEECYAPLNKVTIETAVGSIATGTTITLKLNSGFEFKGNFDGFTVDGNKATMEVTGSPISKLEVTPTVEAVSAKAGDVATLKVSAKNWDAASCDVMEVIDSAVKVTVDADADVPEIYSGTAVGDAGLTSDGDHKALKVTFEESVEDAWDTVKGFTIGLPEGVYVTNSVVTYADPSDYTTKVEDNFAAAYKKGDYEEFVFGRRAFDVVAGQKAKFDLELTLVAEPGFVGDVVLTVEGDGIGSHEVVIAKFVAPYTVEAAQNDVIIDYRNTEIPTDIVIKEAEAGLWSEGGATTKAAFFFGSELTFEDDATIEVDEASEMKIKALNADMAFNVKEESNEEAAVVTINGIELYMSRNLPAGAYDLTLNTSMAADFLAEDVFGDADSVGETYYEKGFTHTVKEAWVNVVTAGRDKDDASFTKKVVVPVGEAYLIAGEETVALDVPAYINAAGYTMLPVRAVATALGIHNNNVIWSQAAKQVTILYGQRIITMTVGQSVIYVNGSAIPAAAAVEVVDGRAFLGLRDLANALGVVEINWDGATNTATLN